jgi:hypothetical protein
MYPGRRYFCGYTANEGFEEADLVVSELGDPPHVQIDLTDLRQLVSPDR